MKKPRGFTIIELLVASAIGLIALGIVYGAYEIGIATFQFNEERIDAVSKLWLSMDKIKKDIREGKDFIRPSDFPYYFPKIIIPVDSLVFTTNDTTAIAFYTSEDGDLCEGISNPTSTKVITSGVTLSQVISVPFAEINLTTSWTYRGTTRQENISSVICLRNWERE